MSVERFVVAQVNSHWAVVAHGVVVNRLPNVSQALRLAVEAAWECTRSGSKALVVVQRYGQDTYAAWDSDRDSYTNVARR